MIVNAEDKKDDDEEEKKRDLMFQGESLVSEDGKLIKIHAMTKLVEKIMLNFQNVCKISSSIGYDKVKKKAYFVDQRDDFAKRCYSHACMNFVVQEVEKDFIGVFRVPPVMLANALLAVIEELAVDCLLYTSPSPRDGLLSRMPSSA